TGPLTAFAVFVPALGQEQVGVEQGLVTPAGGGQMDGDDAVLHLAQLAAMLTLYAGGLVPLLGVAALVDDANGAGAVLRQFRQQRGDVLLEELTDAVVVPAMLGEEQLHGANASAGSQGDGLGGLAFEVREQTAAVGSQVAERLCVLTAELELVEVICQRRSQVEDLLLGQALDSWPCPPNLGIRLSLRR